MKTTLDARLRASYAQLCRKTSDAITKKSEANGLAFLFDKLEFTFYSSLIFMFPILVIEIAAQHDWDNRKTAIKNAPKQDH